MVTSVTTVTTFGRGLGLFGQGYTCVFFCAYGVSREGYRFILVTEVTEVMKTIICSETLQLLTGPQLRGVSQTECQDGLGEALWRCSRHGVRLGHGELRVLQM
jgi:hypothetical protein